MGSLQLQILRVLWQFGSCTAAEVHLALTETNPLAITTIATMLRKMEARGLVRHRQEGRKFIYEAAVQEKDVTTKMTEEVLDTAFEGRVSDLVHHLLTTREIDPIELDEIEKMIRDRKKGGKS